MTHEGWPAWATAPIEIVDPDARWPMQAAALIAALEPLLAPWLAGRVIHVGSTAVPELAAKPVLDLYAPVRSVGDAAEADAPLAAHGWHLVPPELVGAHRRLHVLPDGDRRVAHLHLAAPEAAERVVRFRDALRGDATLRDAYAELKRHLAQVHRGDREAYTEAKSEFVAQALRR